MLNAKRISGKDAPRLGTEQTNAACDVATTSETQQQQPARIPRGHYDVLHLGRTASAGDVRTAYRRCALKTHPDKGGDPEQFRLVVAAFEVLADTAQRAAYDQELLRLGKGDGITARGERFPGFECPGTPVAPATPAGQMRCPGTPTAAAVPGAACQGTPGRMPATPVPGRMPGTPRPGASADRSLRGLVREAHLKLMDVEPASWEVLLSEMNTAALEALHAWLTTRIARSPISGKFPEGALDALAFPREVEVPEGLPQGWKCIQHLYKSGANKGRIYTRFTSPWGDSGFCTKREAVRADALHRGEDPVVAVRCWERDQRRAPCDGDIPKDDIAAKRVPQKGIITQGKSYTVQVSWACFRVVTQSTPSLTQAIGWHIALLQLRELAQERMQERIKGGDASPDPLTKKEVLQLLGLEPEMKPRFFSGMGRGNAKNICTPACEHLDVAIANHRKLVATVESGASRELIKKERDAMLAEVAQRGDEFRARECQLMAAVRFAVSARTDAAREALQPAPPAGGDGPQQTMAVASLQPPPPEDAAAKSTIIAASSHGANFAAADVSTCSRSQRRDLANAAAAAKLMEAMHLKARSACLLAERLRALTHAELRRRLEALALPPPPRTRRQQGRSGEQQQQQQALPTLAMAEAASVQGQRKVNAVASEQAVAAAKVALTPVKGSQIKPSLSGALALPAPPRPARPAVPPSVALAAGRLSMPQPFCQEIAPLAFIWLGPRALCRCRAASPAATCTVDSFQWNHFQEYVYCQDFFTCEVNLSRKQRPLRVPCNDASSKLVRFLTQRHHAAFFCNLDLTQAPITALECVSLQSAFSRMPHLQQIRLSWTGWSTPSARTQFLRALPTGTSFEGRSPLGGTAVRGSVGSRAPPLRDTA